jgi:hypothetical protein
MGKSGEQIVELHLTRDGKGLFHHGARLGCSTSTTN